MIDASEAQRFAETERDHAAHDELANAARALLKAMRCRCGSLALHRVETGYTVEGSDGDVQFFPNGEVWLCGACAGHDDEAPWANEYEALESLL